ncbi:hypothetical protein DFR87_13160 [Metallosphaera hakonensis JCM 8857 = DSM 7519]|nr:hypothetical protein DFR87_13160 [Metallosphaera hakonensis JCM 8857 = DSM 7519]
MWYAYLLLSAVLRAPFRSLRGWCDPQMWSSALCLWQGGAEKQEIPTARWEALPVRTGWSSLK